MPYKTTYTPGEALKICDRCGFKKKTNQTKKQWNNLVVCYPECYEERQPQQFFVRGVKDIQRVPDARPEQIDTFIDESVRPEDAEL